MKRGLLTIVLALAGTIYACKNPVQDVQIGLKTASSTSVELRFRPQDGALPSAINVKISGPDADKVFTVLDTKNFRVDDDGLLKLTTKTSVAPDAQHPIRFTVVATADHFVEAVQPVELSDENQRTVSVTLLNKQADVAPVQVSAQSDGAGSLNKTMSVQAAGSGQVTVTIPQGTQLKDATAEPVDGQLTVTMLPMSDAPVDRLPNGGVINNATTATGQPVESQRLSDVAGAVSLEIHNEEYQTVKTFSKPIRIAFAVDPQTVNPATGQAVRAGDQIPVFSYDAATDRWQSEQAGTVETNSQTGRLECVAAAPHLSTWVAAYPAATCADGPTFNVKSNFKDYDVPFFCQVVYVDKNGQDQDVASSFYRELIDGSDISVGNLVQNKSVRLKVYENPADLRKFIASPVTSSCSKGKTNFDLRALKIPATATAMTYIVQFPCKNVDDKKLPEQVTAQFRQTGTATWNDLVTLYRKDIKGDRLQGTTYKATKGKRYDYRVKLFSYSFEQPNQLMDRNEWLIKINTNEFCKK